MKRKVFYCILCVMAFMLSLAGCSSKESGTGSSDYKNYVYRVEDFALLDEEQSINQLLCAGDKIYGCGYQWAEDGSGSFLMFYELQEDGSLTEAYKIVLGVYDNFSYVTMDDEGNFYCINNIYGPLEDGSDEYQDIYYLEKRTLNGEIIFSINLNELPELKALGEDYFYVGSMVIIPDQGIYLNVRESLVRFDFDGNLQQIVSQNGDGGSLAGANLILLSDNRVAAVLYEDTGVKVALADMEKGTIGEKYQLPGNAYEYSFYAGIGYDLYLVNYNGVYGYNIGEEEHTQLMNYVDSDCGFYSVYNLRALSETEFLAMYSSMDGGGQMMAKFTKVAPEDVKEKQVITLACAYTDYTVSREVVRFNKENENYRITIKDYSSLYGTEDDAGITRLNADIVSGNVPDILILDDSMPIDSYISKGLFEDLKPYIENDSEMDYEDFIPNIMEAFSVDGKLYQLVPHFTIQTLVARTSEVGKDRGWTVEEAVALWKSKPEGTEFITEMSRDTVLRYCMTMAGDQFIDWEEGKCDFNSEGFIQTLEFLAMFPEEVDDAIYTDEYWISYDSMWREGKVLTCLNTVGDFRNYNYMKAGTFGEDITMIGFPSSNEDGSVIVPGMELVMSSKSKCKDGVWEFLRIFLLEEYQSSDNVWGFPVSSKQFDQIGELAMERPSYEDENGNRIEYDDTYYVGNMEIVIEPMTKEEVEDFKQQIYSFTQVYHCDENLINIIKEEAAAYFNGQKTAKDVANVIQSRAQIYVNETR